VLSFLVFVVGVLVVGGLLFLGAALLLGRGETQPPAELDRSPLELPDDRPVTGEDVRAVRMSVTVRGYRMTEVDWLVDQLATALDERDRDLADLRAQLAERPPAQRLPVQRPAIERPAIERPTGERPAVDDPTDPDGVPLPKEDRQDAAQPAEESRDV
jgi:DivIVA domain-containing protein